MSIKRNNVAGLLHFQFFITMILLLSGSRGVNAQDNFNGGFEVKSLFKNEPVSWYATVIPQTKGFVTFAWDSTEKHSGARSVSIEIDSKHPQDVIAYNWTRTYPDFKIGQKYSFSGWVKTKNLKGPAFICIQCWDETGRNMLAFFTTQEVYHIQGTNDWTLIQSSFTAPKGTKQVRLRAGIASPENNGGKVWFDDIKIE